MRIIGGKYKGKSLNHIKSFTTRPLKDVVKENIFNILSHSNEVGINLESSKVLDLYSGTGSFGIECVSRGAKKVTFVEKDKNALKVLKKNLSEIKINNEAILIDDSVENYLSRKKKEKYNIFFFDPPFSEKKFSENLRSIRIFKNFFKNHIVVIHREKDTQDDFENEINILKIKIYGRSKIFFGVFKIFFVITLAFSTAGCSK